MVTISEPVTFRINWIFTTFVFCTNVVCSSVITSWHTKWQRGFCSIIYVQSFVQIGSFLKPTKLLSKTCNGYKNSLLAFPYNYLSNFNPSSIQLLNRVKQLRYSYLERGLSVCVVIHTDVFRSCITLCNLVDVT